MPTQPFFLVGWKTVYCGIGNTYVLYPNEADCCITMTGSAVTREVRLPRGHRLTRIELTHLDAAYAENTAALDVTLSIEQGKVEGSPYHCTDLWREVLIVDSRTIKGFGEGFEREETTYLLSLKTTNTHKMSARIYVQVQGVKD